MNIVCWNVNGLRALYKKERWQWLIDESPDFICLQETKAHISQLPPEVASPTGYFSLFSSSEIKKGYSGVAVYTKHQPQKVEYGIGIPEFDQEGRILALYYESFVLFNIYFPNGGGGPTRLDYKLRFYDAFLARIEKIRTEEHKEIIFCGDVNTAHEAIDLARPKENEENTGFLPEERAWIDEVINHGYFDCFRHFNPNKMGVYTYWDMKTAARERNVGWRIDYFFVSSALINKVQSVKIHSDIFGSDHCPIELKLDNIRVN